jgi:hypothetical protein
MSFFAAKPPFFQISHHAESNKEAFAQLQVYAALNESQEYG